MKNKRGGARNGAGRKPISDKKVPLRIFPRQSQIDACGGEDQAKDIALKAIERKAKK